MGKLPPPFPACAASIGRLNLSKESEEEAESGHEEATGSASGLSVNRTREVIIPEEEPDKTPVLKRRPTNSLNQRSMGLLSLQQGSEEMSLEELLEAIEQDPLDSELYFEVGKIYSEEGQKKKAISYLEWYFVIGGRKEAAKELLESLNKNQSN